jgi:DNA adenine methylase
MTAQLSQSAPKRPLLRWHGGKWLLAPWIIGHFPPHLTYVEPFGGAASVLLRKPRSHIEIWNDLDEDLVNLFCLLQDADAGAELMRRLKFTPFARAEFERSFNLDVTDPVERARRFIVRSFMGFGSNACSATARGSNSTGFRARSQHPRKQPAQEWANYPDAIEAIVERVRGVVIERRDALRLISDRDGEGVLIYADPPYLPETRELGSGGRKRPGRYRHEMNAEGHRALLQRMATCRAMVVLSGYRSDLYLQSLPGWRCVEKQTHADGARPRVECLWINPQACRALDEASAA